MLRSKQGTCRTASKANHELRLTLSGALPVERFWAILTACWAGKPIEWHRCPFEPCWQQLELKLLVEFRLQAHHVNKWYIYIIHMCVDIFHITFTAFTGRSHQLLCILLSASAHAPLPRTSYAAPQSSTTSGAAVESQSTWSTAHLMFQRRLEDQRVSMSFWCYEHLWANGGGKRREAIASTMMYVFTLPVHNFYWILRTEKECRRISRVESREPMICRAVAREFSIVFSFPLLGV